MDGIAAPPMFGIDSNTGRINLTAPLDFETKSLHEFPVMAIDKGGFTIS